MFSYEDVLKAFFLLDDPNMTKDVIDELVNTYKEKELLTTYASVQILRIKRRTKLWKL